MVQVMKIDFAQTKHVVEKCWEVAITASLPGVGEMLQGPAGFNSVRLGLFQQLVSHLVPNYQVYDGSTKGSIEVTREKEEWES